MSSNPSTQDMKVQADRPFRPWRGDLKAAAFAFLIAVALGWAGLIGMMRMPSSGLAWIFLFLAIALWGLVFHKLRRARARFHGKRVEHRAVRDLSYRIGPRYEVCPGVMTRHGDIDAQVRDRETGQKWAIEIKSHRAVRVHAHLIGDDTLSSTSAHMNKQIPGFLAQARQSGATSGGTPVLWFPQAGNRGIGQVQGVLVVTGPAALLVKACHL